MAAQRVAQIRAALAWANTALLRRLQRQSHHEIPQDSDAAGPKNFSHFEAGEF